MAEPEIISVETGTPIAAIEPSPVQAQIPDYFRLPERFAAVNRLIMRDLNAHNPAKAFGTYTKENIIQYLTNPAQYSAQLRDAIIYLYTASSHFRRLIQYFTTLSDLNYVVSPYKIDVNTANVKTVRRNFYRVINLLASMDLKNQGEKILSAALREDVFYGTFRETSGSITIQQLPSDYCAIAVIEDNVLNVSFDFSYFDSHKENLVLYPEEFTVKYNLYKNNRTKARWQELSAPNSFAVKASKDIISYAVPPFAGILRDIFDIEEYKDMKLTKTDIENYALLVMRLGISDDGKWQMDLDKAKGFWSNLDHVLPSEIGAVLSPMPIEKISFERTHAADSDTVSEAEQNMFTGAGVSSLLFNNEKASSNALLLSIKADQALTYSIVKSLETVLNRYIHRQGYGKYFSVTFLDTSPFNRKEAGDAYLKACQYGIPMVSYYCASQGLLQNEMDGMNFLEDTVLGIKDRFRPLQSSATQSAITDGGEEGAGRPRSELGELGDAGEQTQEDEE